MLAERQTDRQTDRHSHYNTPLPYWGGECGVIITYNRYDRISKAELNTYYSDRPAGLSRNAKRKGKNTETSETTHCHTTEFSGIKSKL